MLTGTLTALHHQRKSLVPIVPASLAAQIVHCIFAEFCSLLHSKYQVFGTEVCDLGHTSSSKRTTMPAASPDRLRQSKVALRLLSACLALRFSTLECLPAVAPYSCLTFPLYSVFTLLSLASHYLLTVTSVQSSHPAYILNTTSPPCVFFSSLLSQARIFSNPSRTHLLQINPCEERRVGH